MIIYFKQTANIRNLALPGMIIVCCCIVCRRWLKQAHLGYSHGWSARRYCSGVMGSIPKLGMLGGIFSTGFSSISRNADCHLTYGQRVGYSTELVQL